MSKHDAQVSLRDMLDNALEAVELLGNSSREELGNNRMMQLALTRLMEIHGYDIIDYDLLWDTVNFDLPPLIQSLQQKLDLF